MRQKFFSEFIGTTFLLMMIVGSGIMGENLSQGNEALALLANSLATGFGLFVLIESLSELSGAHFNPMVSLIEFLSGKIQKKEMLIYWGAQFLGAIMGVVLVHIMFNQQLFQISHQQRLGLNLWVSEVVATFGLISLIIILTKKRPTSIPISVAVYITSAYWFTSSTSFANPAVTLARVFTDTLCGIAPNAIFLFFSVQILGTFFAFYLLKNSAVRS